MPRAASRQETDPVVCGRCGGMGYVRAYVRYCSGCGRTTVGCNCTGDRRQTSVLGRLTAIAKAGPARDGAAFPPAMP